MEQSQLDSMHPTYELLMAKRENEKYPTSPRLQNEELDWLNYYNRERSKRAVVDLLVKHNTTVGVPDSVTIEDLCNYVSAFVVKGKQFWFFYNGSDHMLELVKELEDEHECRVFMQDGEVRVKRYTWW